MYKFINNYAWNELVISSIHIRVYGGITLCVLGFGFHWFQICHLLGLSLLSTPVQANSPGHYNDLQGAKTEGQDTESGHLESPSVCEQPPSIYKFEVGKEGFMYYSKDQAELHS